MGDLYQALKSINLVNLNSNNPPNEMDTTMDIFAHKTGNLAILYLQFISCIFCINFVLFIHTYDQSLYTI